MLIKFLNYRLRLYDNRILIWLSYCKNNFYFFKYFS